MNQRSVTTIEVKKEKKRKKDRRKIVHSIGKKLAKLRILSGTNWNVFNFDILFLFLFYLIHLSKSMNLTNLFLLFLTCFSSQNKSKRLLFPIPSTWKIENKRKLNKFIRSSLKMKENKSHQMNRLNSSISNF